MNEETKVFNENEITEVEVMDTDVTTEDSGIGILGALAVTVTVAGAAIGGWLLKKSGKLEARRIKKLEKKGYTVIPPELPEEIDAECEETSNEETA